MKKIIIIANFFLLSLFLKGQEEDERAFNLGVGYEDNGLYGEFSYQSYIREAQFWRIGTKIHLEDIGITSNTDTSGQIDVSTSDISTQLYLGYLDYYRSILTWGYKTTPSRLYAGIGIVGGYELINNGKSYSDLDRQINAESKFIYGGSAGLEIEQYLFSNGSSYHYKDYYLFVSGKYNYYVNSDIGEIQPSISAGIRMVF